MNFGVMEVCYIVLHCVALRCVALRCVALRCVALRCVALRCVALRCVALRCVALRCVILNTKTIKLHYQGDNWLIGCKTKMHYQHIIKHG